MYDAMKRHEIQTLKKAGLSHARAAEVCAVSERTVRRVHKEPPLGELSADAAGPSAGRPSKIGPYRPFLEGLLGEEPRLPSVEILRRVRQAGYDGGKSALYALVAKLRPPAKEPVVRFEGLAGEFSQHDFGSILVTYEAAPSERVHFFASRLKYSRWSHVTLVADEAVESLVRALLLSFEAFGGVPLVAVFDNPKTVVLRHVGDKIEWNSTFGQVALDYRFAPELCAPWRANQKGSVENLVGWVKKSFFKARRFHDREDLERQLKEWLREVNEERPSRATGVTARERMKEEGERLRPLAIPPREYPLRLPAMVGPTGVVWHNGIRYSMPPESIGFPATLFLYCDRVRIVARHYEAEHPREPPCGSESFLAEHRSAMLAVVSGRRARLYFKRQQLLELGPQAEQLLTELVHRHPRTWQGEVETLFDLLGKVGEARLLEAIRLAVSRRLFGASFVENILEREVA
jgi:transposase